MAKAAPAALPPWKRPTRISTDIDYDRDGKQVSWLRLPYSSNVSAYGWIAIPIAVIKNGRGPTALLQAGNHGDEYEGQIALVKLIRELRASDIQGRVIVLPAANFPAAMAGLRTSPIDKGNLNRAFPGDPDGTPTFQIAHYIDSVLMPMAEVFHDLHSGGNTLDYLPFASTRLTDDNRLHKECLAALKAFNPPIGMVWRGLGEERIASFSAHRNEVVGLGSEFGGCGTVSIEGLQVVERGIRNLLAHFRIIEPPKRRRGEPEPAPSRLMEIKNQSYFVYAQEAGLFEPYCKLGETVRRGQAAGAIHFVDNPGRAPVIERFQIDGFLVCKRAPGRCERGDCLAHLATDLAA
jgi:uncharacterized protein